MCSRLSDMISWYLRLYFIYTCKNITQKSWLNCVCIATHRHINIYDICNILINIEFSILMNMQHIDCNYLHLTLVDCIYTGTQYTRVLNLMDVTTPCGLVLPSYIQIPYFQYKNKPLILHTICIHIIHIMEVVYLWPSFFISFFPNKTQIQLL